MSLVIKLRIVSALVMSGGTPYPMGYTSKSVYFFTLVPGLLLLFASAQIESKRKR